MKKELLSVPYKLIVAFLLLIYSLIGLLLSMFLLWGSSAVKQNGAWFGLGGMTFFVLTVSLWVFYFRAVNSNSKKTMRLLTFVPLVPVVSLLVYMVLESN